MWTMAYMTAILAALIGAPPAGAQTPGAANPPRPTITNLHLSAVGSVSIPPDELVADLAAEATSASAAEAQHKVNAMIARGLREARTVEGLAANATDYSVNQVDLDANATPGQSGPRRMGWSARQTLELRSKDGDPLLTLVGKLQDEGLAVASLGWQLSPGQDRKARDAAMVEALEALQARATTAAQTLGLKVDRLRDVRVDMPEPAPIRPMMAMRMNAAAAPEATASPREITSEVSADVLLTR